MAKSATAVVMVAVAVEIIEDAAELESKTDSPSPLISAGLGEICFGHDEPRSNPDYLDGWC
jgi:hypothetical protein